MCRQRISDAHEQGCGGICCMLERCAALKGAHAVKAGVLVDLAA